MIPILRAVVQPTDHTGPRINWRIHPGITAGLYLIVCALAAVTIYSPFSPGIRIIVAIFALVFLFGAVGASRIAVVADDEGIAVRTTFTTTWIDWDDVSDIVMTERFGGTLTLRIALRGGGGVNVPPSLVQPTRPSNRQATAAHIGGRLSALQRARPR
jgi:Bacterial PH domain